MKWQHSIHPSIVLVFLGKRRGWLMDLLNCNRGGEAVSRYPQNPDPGLTIQPSKYDHCRLHKLDSPQKSDRAGLSLPSSHSHSIGPSHGRAKSVSSFPSIRPNAVSRSQESRSALPTRKIVEHFFSINTLNDTQKVSRQSEKFADIIKSFHTMSKVSI